MGLFYRKPEVATEEFCQQFYDSHIFHPMIANINFDEAWWGIIFNSLVEADQSFVNINQDVFIKEMAAVRLELFGLAWGHRYKQDQLIIAQSVFTRNYLEEKGYSELWKIMGDYNQAIAESVTMTENTLQMDVWQVKKVNNARFDMFERWRKTNISDPSVMTEELKRSAKCIGRVSNHVGADITGNDCIAVKRLAVKLADRLDCDTNLNGEALFRLGAAIYNLYEGARKAIKDLG